MLYILGVLYESVSLHNTLLKGVMFILYLLRMGNVESRSVHYLPNLITV